MSETLGQIVGTTSVPLECRVVRSLTSDDWELLRNPPRGLKSVPSIQKLSHAHHTLARELVKGSSEIEAGLIAGYTKTRVNSLKADPAFQELLAYYQTQKDIVQIDVLEKMRMVGLQFVEELAGRLEADPAAFSARELMEGVDLMLVKGRQAPGSRAGTGAGTGTSGPVTISIGFVKSENSGTVIDITSEGT